MNFLQRSKGFLKSDRLSSLPDSLLGDILTRLKSTKQSIKTGTLSKRWEHVWLQIPYIIINHDDFDDDDKYDLDSISDFYLCIQNILIRFGDSKLIKFQLQAPFDCKTEDLESCIRQTMDLKVQDFEIDVWDIRSQTGFTLPDFF